MGDSVLNMTQYAEYLGFCIQTFSSLRKKHPEDFAPSFRIGKHERWYLSTIEKFHHDNETQKSEPIDGEDINNTTGGSPIS